MSEQQGTAIPPETGTPLEAGMGPDTRTGPDTKIPPDTGTARYAERVPHVEPLMAHPAMAGQVHVTGPAAGVSDDELNQQIADALTELIKQAHDLGHSIATDFGLSASDAKALFLLGTPMTMKDLGLRMGCDPSFVTFVADALEKHGLARREPSQRDRRSKNIVLTPEGAKMRDRLCHELSARAPWCNTLDTGERQCLLHLMRKMLRFCGGR